MQSGQKLYLLIINNKNRHIAEVAVDWTSQSPCSYINLIMELGSGMFTKAFIMG